MRPEKTFTKALTKHRICAILTITEMNKPINGQGKSIRRLREAAGISLTDLAAKVGLENHSYLSRAERGEVPMTNALYLKCRAGLITLAEQCLEAVSEEE